MSICYLVSFFFFFAFCYFFLVSSVQFSSVAQSCPTLCDPMNRSTPGLPVHYQLPEFTQTHVHRVSDAIHSHSIMSDLLFATPWTAAHQTSLSITNSLSLLKLTSIKSAMPFNHLILCHPLLLLPSVFPSIRVFSNESVFCIRWPKYLMSRNICLLQCHEDVSLSFLL